MPFSAEETNRKYITEVDKSLVKMMVEDKVPEVIDPGVDIAPEQFVQAAETAGISDNVKIMIGGVSVTRECCDSVGADYYTAASAAICAANIVGKGE